MAGEPPVCTPVRFGPFELFVESGELRKNGVRLKLSGQPIQVLSTLVASPGRLITREELQHQLWPASSFGDFEKGLNAAVNRLRENLHDSAHDPRYIETIPGRGYRFIHPVEPIETRPPETTSPAIQPETTHRRRLWAAPSGARQPASSGKWVWVSASAAILAIAAAAIIWWNRPSEVPVVEAITQVTNDGHTKGMGALVTDGSRIYFNEGVPGGKKIMQVSIAGGETSEVSTRLTDPWTDAIAPDGSALMVFDGEADINPLWIVPLPTGESRRLGTIEGYDGSFFPDGRVVFAKQSGIFTADKDGSNVRKLLVVGDSLGCPKVSPDGRRIVVGAFALQDRSNYLAEVAADGSDYHEIMRSSSQNLVACGSWTPDGHYVVTRLGGDIWLLPMNTGLMQKQHKPVQLTNGPLLYSSLCPSRDGKSIFAIGSKLRGELVQYDNKSRQFTSFLSGISAVSLTFSRDGQWVTYVSYPDYTLWRSRADGTGRFQLTYLPTQVDSASISPDGTRIAFSTNRGKTFVMNIDGTSQREIPRKNAYVSSWSPDGNSLLFVVLAEGTHIGEKDYRQLETIDLRNGNRSVVASADGGLWIDSDTVIAGTDDAKKLVVIDLQSGKRDLLVSGLIVDFAASLDQKYVYYATGGAEPKAMRIRLSDRKVEEITSLKKLLRPMNVASSAMSVAPDGSPIFTRDIGTQEIYALTVKWP